MKNITLLLKGNRVYFISLSTMLVTVFTFLVFQGRYAAFIPLDAFHPFWLNVFFINYTFMGNIIFALSLIAMLYFYYGKKQPAYTMLSSFLISGFAIQVLKNLVNGSIPKLYLEAGTYLSFTDGVTFSAESGSPSAHTATAFAITTVLVLMTKNKKMSLFFLVAAAMVGYSRIYLAGHFLMDIITGSLTGTVSGIIAVYLAQYKLGLKVSFTKWHRIGGKNVPTPADMQRLPG